MRVSSFQVLYQLLYYLARWLTRHVSCGRRTTVLRLARATSMTILRWATTSLCWQFSARLCHFCSSFWHWSSTNRLMDRQRPRLIHHYLVRRAVLTRRCPSSAATCRLTMSSWVRWQTSGRRVKVVKMGRRQNQEIRQNNVKLRMAAWLTVVD